jgi:nucleotide-binding universal stress UspA family protein
VIVGAHNGSVDERLGVGEIARRALEIACCGVIVLGTDAPAPRLRRMLLPLDGTPSTASAIGPAGELARSAGAELDILLVGEAHPKAGPTSVGVPASALEPGAMAPRYMDQPHHEWAAFTEEFLHRFVAAIGHVPPGVTTRFFLGRGLPADEILRFAVELASDLVVLVWHGELSEDHGAVFRQVMRRTPCPVLVLRR